MKKKGTALAVITSLALLAFDSFAAETNQTNAYNAFVLRVQDPDGKPIANAHAICLPDSYDNTKTAPVVTYTNGGGKIVIERATSIVKGYSTNTNGVMMIHCRQREMRVELDAEGFTSRVIPLGSLSVIETNTVTLDRNKIK